MENNIDWTSIRTTDAGGTYTLEERLKNVLRCAGADASRNTDTKMWSVKRGLKVVLEHEPTTAQIKATFSKMPNNWNTLVHVGWYMNATNTLINKNLAMEYFKSAINMGINVGNIK
tara:strand:+ start:1040 stop:1387 length:348 start_codon:yes stop_codon:yes gene_type:complete